MKKYACFLLLLAAACTNSKNENTSVVDSVKTLTDTVTAVPTVAGNTNENQFLKTIMGTGEGLLRGVTFGMPIASVKKIETGELFEEDDAHVGYTFDTDNLETVDILYNNDKNKQISGVQVDVYMNSKEANVKLIKELESLFTTRYGQPVKEGNSISWKMKPAGQLNVKDVSKSRDIGLEIIFSKK